MTVAPWEPCGAKGPPYCPPYGLVARRPSCNRQAGHEGPHRQYTRTADVKAEWGDAEVTGSVAP